MQAPCIIYYLRSNYYFDLMDAMGPAEGGFSPST